MSQNKQCNKTLLADLVHASFKKEGKKLSAQSVLETWLFLTGTVLNVFGSVEKTDCLSSFEQCRETLLGEFHIAWKYCIEKSVCKLAG